MDCYSIHFEYNSLADDELCSKGLWSPYYFEAYNDAVSYGDYYKSQNSEVEDFTVEAMFGVVLNHDDTMELLNECETE